MTDIAQRLLADADRWMSGDMGRDNEEAGLLSHQAAETILALRGRIVAADKALYDGLVKASGARGLRITRLTDAISEARAALATEAE